MNKITLPWVDKMRELENKLHDELKSESINLTYGKMWEILFKYGKKEEERITKECKENEDAEFNKDTKPSTD